MQATTQSITERVADARKKAIETMRDSGFQLDDTIHVAVDRRLPFMGYSHPQGEGYRIVVAGGAVESGMLEGLLIHEMSHIYRMQTHHPSHNGRIIEEVIQSLGKNAISKDYQRKIIHDLVNNVEDLYADDIALRVLKTSRILPMDQMSSFFQDWVTDEIVESRNAQRDRWVNAYTMANNARAIAQMKRHGVEDTGGRAAETNERFLTRVSPSIARQFDYFQDLLRNMKENVTEDDYRELLTDYLHKFLKVAEGT